MNFKKLFLRFWPYLILATAVFAAYSNIFGNAFLFDDEFLIEKNRFLTSWSYLGNIFANSSTAGFGGVDSFYRPLQGFLYLITYQIAGLSTTAFHTLNLGIHILNVCLLYVLGRRLGFGKIGVFLACLIWGLHPLHVEAVTYQSATADVLYTFWILLGAIVLLPRPTLKRIYLSMPFFVGGLLSKESAIVFPVIAMVLIWFSEEQTYRLRNYLKTLPLWVLAGIYLILRKTFLNFDNTFHFYKTANIYTENILYRCFTFLASLPSYFGLFVAPHDLHMERDFPVYTSIGAVAVLGGAALVLGAVFCLFFRDYRKRKEINFSILWYFSSQIPHMGILIPVNSLFLEHWMYLASSGFLLGLVGFLEKTKAFSRKFFLIVPAALVLAVVFACITYRQNETWKDPITFYNHILEYEKGTQRVHNNLAMAYSDQGDFTQAAEHYRISIDRGDVYPQTQHNLGLLLLNTGHIEEGLQHLKRATEIDPNFYHSYRVLAEVYERLHQPEEARKYKQKYEETKKKFGL